MQSTERKLYETRERKRWSDWMFSKNYESQVGQRIKDDLHGSRNSNSFFIGDLEDYCDGSTVSKDRIDCRLAQIEVVCERRMKKM